MSDNFIVVRRHVTTFEHHYISFFLMACGEGGSEESDQNH